MVAYLKVKNKQAYEARTAEEAAVIRAKEEKKRQYEEFLANGGCVFPLLLWGAADNLFLLRRLAPRAHLCACSLFITPLPFLTRPHSQLCLA